MLFALLKGTQSTAPTAVSVNDMYIWVASLILTLLKATLPMKAEPLVSKLVSVVNIYGILKGWSSSPNAAFEILLLKNDGSKPIEVGGSIILAVF